jgi:hypothetical protein
MKKISAIAALTLACAALASPAHADGGDNYDQGISAANNWNFTTAAVCFQELAVVPAGGDWVGDTVNNCLNGNVLNHTK